MWWTDGWGYGPAWMILAPLCMLILLAVCVGVLYFAARNGRRDSRPVGILRERFARGEISQTEFEERRRVLSDG
jgi:putative membrane protein